MTMAGNPASAASSTMWRKSTVLPEPEPAMMAMRRRSSRVGSLTGSSPPPMRRPTGMESAGADAGTAGLGFGSAEAGGPFAAAGSLDGAAVMADFAAAPFGVVPGGVGVAGMPGVPGAGLSLACLKNCVASNGFWVPFLDTYRTMCLAPQGSFRRLLEEIRAA
jgi:hypothetical protein